MKTFWNLGETGLDEVLQGSSIFEIPLNGLLGAALLDGDHHGRLAIEQTYGYMFHNTVTYGIITTINSFAFLRRQRGGKLNLTRLIPATRTDPTMLCLLYYFSHLCAITPPLVETHDDGRPITVIRAGTDLLVSTLAPLPSAVRISSTPSLQSFRLDPPRRSPRFQPRDSPPIISVLPSPAETRTR